MQPPRVNQSSEIDEISGEKNLGRNRGCKPKITPIGATEPKWEAERSKTRLEGWRCLRCIFPTFLDIFEKFRPREIFWHQLDQDRLRIDGKILVWKKSMKKSDLPWRSCCGPVFANPAPKNSQKFFLPKNYLRFDSRDSRGVHIDPKMARKMSGFSPFLTPCAQRGGYWGPWGGCFEVPPGAHQITPQGHWSGSY